jgi:hypothetical protein
LISEYQQQSIDDFNLAAKLCLMDIKEYFRELGKKGGKARAESLTPEQKTKIALSGVMMRAYLKNLREKKDLTAKSD